MRRVLTTLAPPHQSSLPPVNIALLGFVGYKAQAQQKSWKPADRRIVTSVAVGLGALFSLEGYGLSSYFSKRDFNGNVKTL